VPELPETETIARDLDRLIRGSRITAAIVHKSDVLREVSARALPGRLRGQVIRRVWRRAKLVVLDLDGEDRIVVQPRFTGALLIDDGSLPERERQYSTVELHLADDRRLHYRDIRRLGTFAVMSPARFAAYEQTYGVEPLDHLFTAAQLSGLLRGSRQAVKKLLMDQRRVVGIGNIYANEALWRSGVDPSREGRSIAPEAVQRLHGAIQGVLAEAIEARGTSFRDYRDATGERGTFAERLAAYGRGGAPCLRCGRTLVETHAIDGRSTVLCVRCQH
jgi:formamidopyrimidine-DNA glycosylase